MAGNKWKQRRPEVEALIAEGRPRAEIARYFGISTARLSAILKQYRAADAKAADTRELVDRLKYAAEVLERGLPEI